MSIFNRDKTDYKQLAHNQGVLLQDMAANATGYEREIARMDEMVKTLNGEVLGWQSKVMAAAEEIKYLESLLNEAITKLKAAKELLS